MNKIDPPDCRDGEALSALARNAKVASFPKLQKIEPHLQAAYAHYHRVGGNPFKVPPLKLGATQRSHLHAHFRSPPRDLAHLTDLRSSTEHRLCPMCGSMHRGTLDHLLPKSTYAEFSIYSRNLVPACKCNSKRGEVLMGPRRGERILHPYYDKCLGERLFAARFTDLGEVPRVETRLVIPRTHPEYAAVAFHFRSIVQRTAVNRYLADRWSAMYRKPGLVIRELARKVSRQADVRRILTKELQLLDELHDGGKNNWNSVFVAGLLEPAVCKWLFERLTAKGRAANGPLGPRGAGTKASG